MLSACWLALNGQPWYGWNHQPAYVIPSTVWHVSWTFQIFFKRLHGLDISNCKNTAYVAREFLACCPGLFPRWEEICSGPQRNARDGPWRLLLQRGYSCGWGQNCRSCKSIGRFWPFLAKHDGVPGIQFWPAHHTLCSVVLWRFPAGFSSLSRNPQGLVLPMRHWEKLDPQGSPCNRTLGSPKHPSNRRSWRFQPTGTPQEGDTPKHQ